MTDHRPLKKLGKVHTKMLNQLQRVMYTFDFDIIYQKGSEMPADYLPRIHQCHLVGCFDTTADSICQKLSCLTKNCLMTPNASLS